MDKEKLGAQIRKIEKAKELLRSVDTELCGDDDFEVGYEQSAIENIFILIDKMICRLEPPKR